MTTRGRARFPEDADLMDCSVADSRTNDFLTPLTAAQREAVCHRDGPLLILAGPGSGKTRVVTHRIAFLLSQSIPAQQIVALTFTNKAAEEMRTRLERLAPGQAVWVGTFHRFSRGCCGSTRGWSVWKRISRSWTPRTAGSS